MTGMKNDIVGFKSPYMAVDCPTCGATVGHWCKRPSGHSGPLVAFHAARRKAVDETAAPEKAPVIVHVTGMWLIETELGNVVNIIQLDDRRIVVIGEGGIELWTDTSSLINSDPLGDHAACIGFIEHEIIPAEERESGTFNSRRFGRSTRRDLRFGYIAHYNNNHVHLTDGYVVKIGPDELVLLTPSYLMPAVGRIAL